MASTAVRPFRQGMRRETAPPPCAMVIFGATGDLTHRKLVPALYNLKREGLLPARFGVVGFARRSYTHEEFASDLRTGVDQFSRRRPVEPAVWGEFAEGLRFVPGEFDNPEAFGRLAAELEAMDKERGTAGNRLYYFATSPSYYPLLFQQLARAGLLTQAAGSFARVIVEKPFGRDLESARALNAEALSVVDESQIFRIDHYLGKETVQNILVFRFGNAIFEPVWNHKYVDHVQITVGESIGVEGRGRFYEEAGALRDIVQNHLLQLVALTAMEPPVAYDAEAIRDEKLKVLRSMPRVTARQVGELTVRGQYGRGSVRGEDVPAYREEEGVAPESSTETFVALRLEVDNWRWAGVPFYVRAGKRLPKRVTEIAVQFRNVPHSFFRDTDDSPLEPNVLALRIQPEEGIALKFGSKVPGPQLKVEPVKMDFLYGTSFGVEPPEAYERLLLDALLGDSTLFTRKDEVEAAWGLVSAIHEGWAGSPPPAFPNYEAGTWGPAAADVLLAREGRVWRRP